jgi:hypothetical protein
MRTFSFDRTKFKNLVHYIIWKCPDPAKLGSVKLHKILWKSDTSQFIRVGTPITGVKYRKRPWGPTADALLQIRDELAGEGKIRWWRDTKFAGAYEKDVYESLAPPPKDFLSSEELAIVDNWISEICLKHTAKSISDDTHGLAWEVAAMGEEMPMQAILAEKRGREPNEEELAWAKEQARKRGFK